MDIELGGVKAWSPTVESIIPSWPTTIQRWLLQPATSWPRTQAWSMLRWKQSVWIHQKYYLQQLIQVVNRWEQALETGRRRPALLISSVEKYSPRFRAMIHDHQSSNHDHQDHDYEHCDRQDLNETNLFELSVETQKETLKRLMAMNKVQVFCFFFLFTIAIIMSLIT